MSNNKTEYHIYSHNDPSVQTLGDFVSEPSSLGIGLDILELLNYKDENNNTNIDKLINLYSAEELDRFEDIIKEVKSSDSSNEKTTSKDSAGEEKSINVDSSQKAEVSSIEIIRDNVLESLLKTPGDMDYLKYIPRSINKSLLDKLYNNDIRLLFTKFLYRIEKDTAYEVLINNTLRTAAEQKKQIALGNSVSDFSWHMVGAAMDIKLISKEQPVTILNKNSSNELWMRSGVVDIADELKLQWGGRFKNVNPDPVHFEASYFFKINQKQYLKSQNIKQVASEEDAALSYTDLPIKIGVNFALPLSKIDRDVLSIETNQTINTVDYNCFLAKHLVELLSDEGYKRNFPSISETFKGTVREIYPHISVWVWSRALSISNIEPEKDGSTTYDHQIINITPYISSLNTTVSDNGGNFNLSLTPITADISSNGWSVQEGTQKSTHTKVSDSINQAHTHYIQDDELKRSRMFFEKALQANDLVFIRFEKLELEDNRGDLDELETISVNDLPNQIFDMIALIDNVEITNEPSSAGSMISVAGRDLVKLIIEDGVYFYPTEFTADGIFSNVKGSSTTGAANSRLNRFGSNGQYLERFQRANKTVEKSLKFLINNLGEIEICPNTLFEGYANSLINRGSSQTIDKRSRAFPVGSVANEEQQQRNDDLKEKILSKIDQILINNEILKGDSIEVFDIIEQFIIKQLDTKTLIVENQSIKSWTEIINEEEVKSKIPEGLMSTFVQPNRSWIDEKDRYIKTSIIANQLESLYKKANKDKLKSSNLKSFKKLNYKKEPKALIPNKNFLTKIPISNFVSEIDNYLKNTPSKSKGLFALSEVKILKISNKALLAKGRKVFFTTLCKKYSDLSKVEKEVFDNIYEFVLNDKGQSIQQSKQAVPPLLAGIWQIIKLVIDDSVKDRRLTDPSIGNENGSILNAIRKICQDPFCEFYTDTYGSQFYFIARKKPFDLESIRSVKKGRVVYEINDLIDNNSGQIEAARLTNTSDINDAKDKRGDRVDTTKPIIQQNLILDIEESDVISDSLKYCTEAYSWYKLQLSNLTSGSSADMAFAYLKAIYFEEFADIFGSKPLDLTTSYIPFSPILDKNKELKEAYFIRQGVYDLRYMIESHAHLPFTRTGTIVINGDRRIKKGNFVRLKSTSELFYVDTVSHSFSISESSINRTTTIQVSRGMVERFIEGVDYYSSEKNTVKSKPSLDYATVDLPNNNASVAKGELVNISYFNICNLFIDETVFSGNSNKSFSDFSKASTSNWKVNKLVFNFFLKKLQFAKDDKEISNAGINIAEK